MSYSLIFLPYGAKQYQYKYYDCCQSLGDNLRGTSGKSVVVAIDKDRLHPFFYDESNLSTYLLILEKIFNIKSEIITSDFLNEVTNADTFKGEANRLTNFNPENCIYVKSTYPPNTYISNKYYVAFHTCLRYLWYSHYTDIAIIATNLYKLDLLEDPIDALAISSSYQADNNRGLLPTATVNLDGLLFFRKKEDVLPELLKQDMAFNSIFYKYPIYFDPIVKVRGTFFTDSEVVIKAKETISGLAHVDNIEDIPSNILRNFKDIIQDYLLMKYEYIALSQQLSNHALQPNKNYPTLLSRSKDTVTIPCVDPSGNNKNFIYLLTHTKNVAATVQ